MRKLHVGLFVCFLSVFFVISGCGVKGNDGKASVALDWVYIPDTLNFAQLPSTVYQGTYYAHATGTYTGYYGWTDTSLMQVTYTIEINAGQEPVLWMNGENGKERRYTIGLWKYSTASVTYVDAAPALAALGPAVNSYNAVDLSQYDVAESFTETQFSGDSKMTVIYKTLKKK